MKKTLRGARRCERIPFMAFKLVGFNLQASLNDKIDEAAERAGMKRSEFIRNALCVAIKAQGIEILPEDLLSNQGARNDLPHRITEAEKRSRKGTRPRGRPRKGESVPKLQVLSGNPALAPVRNMRIDEHGDLVPLSPPQPKPSRRSRKSA